MDINHYQREAVKTAVYNPEQAFEYLFPGLSVEANELLNHYVKWKRDGTLLPMDKVKKELGDVFWFLVVIADELSLDAGSILEDNLKKLADRKARGVIKGSGDDR